jgi:hypothetical protein
MKTARIFVLAMVLLAVVASLTVPVLGKPGKFIDNSRPFGHFQAPGLVGRAEFTVLIVNAGDSGNTLWVDPIHICGSGRGTRGDRG